MVNPWFPNLILKKKKLWRIFVFFLGGGRYPSLCFIEKGEPYWSNDQRDKLHAVTQTNRHPVNFMKELKPLKLYKASNTSAWLTDTQ